MSKMNTNISYALLTIKSIGKRSFEGMGRLINKSGDTISRLLQPSEVSFNLIEQIAVNFFVNSKQLVLIIDDTLIKKIHSQFMQGSGRFYDTKIGRKILAYKLLCAAISDGKYIFPLFCAFLFEELLPGKIQSKEQVVQVFIMKAIKLFSKHRITVVLDGAFATIEFMKWAIDNKIKFEVRMHSNRKVRYKRRDLSIRDIKDLKPKGRQMARTIKVIWHGIKLYITAQRRIDKHGDETVVYLASNFKAKPSEHVNIYKKRWPIEKTFRTSKQYLGLSDCYSTNIDTQMNHIASVFLAFTFAQLEMKRLKLDNPEEALKAFNRKNIQALNVHFERLSRIFGVAYA